MKKELQKKFKIRILETIQEEQMPSAKGIVLRGDFWTTDDNQEIFVTGSWARSFDKNLSVVGFIAELRATANWLEEWWNNYGETKLPANKNI